MRAAETTSAPWWAYLGPRVCRQCGAEFDWPPMESCSCGAWDFVKPSRPVEPITFAEPVAYSGPAVVLEGPDPLLVACGGCGGQRELGRACGACEREIELERKELRR